MKTTVRIISFFVLLSLLAPAGLLAQTTEELEAEMSTWLQARRADPQSYEAAWNLARVLIDLGNRQEKDEEKKSHYVRAVKMARAAVELDPADTWGHHYLAAAVGKQALTEGGKKKIELSKEVREEAQKAIECDPDNDRSHHILGRWNREVANLGAAMKVAAKVVYGGVPKGASNEKAVEHFRKAIAISPDHVNHHLELGITFIRMREYDEAMAEFETALALPDHDPNDPAYKAEARKQIRICEKKIGRRAERRKH